MPKVLFLLPVAAMLQFRILPSTSGTPKLKLGVNLPKKCQIELIRPSPFQCALDKTSHLNPRSISNFVSIQFQDSAAKIRVQMKMTVMNTQSVITRAPPKLISSKYVMFVLHTEKGYFTLETLMGENVSLALPKHL